MRNASPSPLDDAKLYVESFHALEELLLGLSDNECGRIIADPETVRSIQLVLAHHDRFAYFRERLPRSSYSEAEKACEVQGMIRDNIDAVIDCGNRICRVRGAS